MLLSPSLVFGCYFVVYHPNPAATLSQLPYPDPGRLSSVPFHPENAAPARPVCVCRAASVRSLVGLKSKDTAKFRLLVDFCTSAPIRNGTLRAALARRPSPGPQPSLRTPPSPPPTRLRTCFFFPAQVAFRHSSNALVNRARCPALPSHLLGHDDRLESDNGRQQHKGETRPRRRGAADSGHNMPLGRRVSLDAVQLSGEREFSFLLSSVKVGRLTD